MVSTRDQKEVVAHLEGLRPSGQSLVVGIDGALGAGKTRLAYCLACSSGYCIEGPSGSVCTRTCVDACPDGWDCRAVQIAGADIVLLCVPTGEVPADTTQDTGTPSDTDEDIQVQTDVATSDDTTQTDTSLPPLTVAMIRSLAAATLLTVLVSNLR